MNNIETLIRVFADEQKVAIKFSNGEHIDLDIENDRTEILNWLHNQILTLMKIRDDIYKEMARHENTK
jgi:hypothetical protein